MLLMNIIPLTATPRLCILIYRYHQQQHEGKENLCCWNYIVTAENRDSLILAIYSFQKKNLIFYADLYCV